MKNTTFSKVHRAFSWFIDHRVLLIALVLLATVGMGYMASKVEVKTIFSDLLPKTHPYVKVNQQFKSTFGGSNLVTIMVENQKGEIFDLKVLEAVQKLTVGMQQVNGIDTYQIISLASKKIKEIRASTEGVESKPIMWPRLPESPEQMAKLRAAVLNNPLVYGPYVSLDLKATLITADFRDGEIDYTKAFNEIMTQIDEVKKGADGIRAKGDVKLKFVFQTSVSGPRQKCQAIIKDACTKAGIDLELKSVVAAVFFGSDAANPDTYQKFWADMQMFTTTMGSPDPRQIDGLGGAHPLTSKVGIVSPSHTVLVVSTRSMMFSIRHSSAMMPPSPLMRWLRLKPVAMSWLCVGLGKRSPAICSMLN